MSIGIGANRSLAVMTERFEEVFEPTQATVLAEVITDAYNDLVKTSDFSELKAIVKDIAKTQKQTEQNLAGLSTEVRKLSEAQKQTEQNLAGLSTEVRELSEAQKRTEKSLDKLIQVVAGMGTELGGLSRNMAYSLENEAYRLLPGLLHDRLGIQLSERIVRTELNGEEINFLAVGERDGNPILLVGESKLQLGDRSSIRRAAQAVFDQLERKVEAAQEAYPNHEIVRLLVTHYARPAVLAMAAERDVFVVQSFEW